MFSDTNFLRFLEFLKTLKLCFQRDWKSFFVWIWVIQTLVCNLCLISIIQLCKCSFFGFLFVFKILYCVATTEDVSMGEMVKFVSRTFNIPNLGLPGKLKVPFKYWCVNSNRICKCKPTVSTCALSLTFRVHYSNKQTMKEALRDAAGMFEGSDK